jgi:hypothetical protein
MEHHRADHQNQRPRFSDRLELRLSNGRCIDGLWIGGLESEPSPVLDRVEEALRLIKGYDRSRYDRLRRDLERIWVRIVPGALGCFNYSLHACELDRRFVLAEASSPELIAAAIVHEATHARLMRRGVGYAEDLRVRVEAICCRRELAFAGKLPNGEQLRAQAERRLTDIPNDYWTNAAFRDRFDKDHAEALRDLGAPDWLVRTTLALRTVRLGAIGLARRLTRR